MAYMICACCNRPLEEGDGLDSPPLYCDWCEIGWNTPEEAEQFGCRYVNEIKIPMKGDPQMTEQQLMKLHELKGRLAARATILESDISFTSRLKEQLVSDNYNGYANGKAEAYQEWLRSVNFLLAEISQLIREIENAKEQEDLPF